MNKNKAVESSKALRQKAEDLLKSKLTKVAPLISDNDAGYLKLIHELEVHQIELEMQNHELMQANSRAAQVYEKYTDLYDFAPSGYFSFSEDGRIVELNLYGARMLRSDRSQLIDKRFGVFISDRSKPIFSQFLTNAFLSKNNESCEIELLLDRNSPLTFHLNGIVAKKDKLCIVTMIDVSAQKQAEENLRQSQELYKTLFVYNHSAMLIINPVSGEITNANAKACDFYGWTYKELCGRNISEINTLNHEEVISEMELAKTETRKHFNFKHRLANGEERHVEVHSGPIKLGKETLLYSIVHDVSKRYEADENLRISQERWKYALEGASDGVWDWDVESNSVFFSTQWKEMLGYTDDEVENSYNEWRRRIHPDDLEEVMMTLDKHLKGETSLYKNQHRLLCKDGTYKWIQDEGKVILRDEKGNPLRAIGTHKDITASKLNEIALRESEHKFRMLFEQMTQGVVYQNNVGEIISANPAAQKILGLSLDQMQGRSSISPEWQAIHSDGSEFKGEDHPAMIALHTGKEVLNTIMGINNPEVERQIWININATPQFKPGEKKPSNVFATFDDVTDRKLILDALTESELRYKTLFNTSPSGVIVSDENGIIIDANNEVSKTTLIPYNKLIGSKLQLLTSTDGSNQVSENIKRLLQGENLEHEVVNKRDDGSPCYFILKETAITFPSGQKRIITTSIDITDRKLSEERAVKIGKHYQALIHKAPDGIALMNADKHLRFINPSALKMFGFIDNDFVIEQPRDSVHPDDLEMVLVNLKHLNEDPSFIPTLTFRFADNNKNWRWVVCTFTNMLSDKNIEAIVINFRDVTYRKLVDEALQESEERYSKAFQTSPYAILITHPETGKIIEVNDAFTTITGYTLEESLTATIIGINLWVNIKDRELVVAQLLKGKSVSLKEFLFRKKNGEIMTGLFSAQVIYLNGTPCILSSINDITERKLIEEALRSSQEQLKKYTSHLQNLREEDRISLAREIHDEMGQILIAIRFEVGMIKQKVIKGDEKSTPENLLPNIEHLMTLVDQTIKTTRKIMIDLRSEENEKFEFIEAVNIYAVEFEKRYKIECVVICDLEKLSVNSQKSIALFRIFQEALSNVVRHAKASRVEVHIQVIKKIFRLEISDNGVGYKSEQKAKPKSFGILGIKERVSMLEGEFDISSSIGKGTKLKIEIPYLN